MLKLALKTSQTIGITAMLSFALTAEFLTTVSFSESWFQTIIDHAKSLLHAPETQPLCAISLTIYASAFLFLAKRRSPSQSQRLACVAVVYALTLSAYFFAGGAHNFATLDVVVLFGAAVIGLALDFCIGLSSRPRSEWLGQVFFVIITILTVGSMSENSSNLEYQYRGVERHTGIWKNPNTFGLLMGCGLVLSLGSLIQAGWQNLPAEARNRPFLKRWAWLLFLPLSGVLLAGLIQSLSRGAWLGTALALAWLSHHFLKMFCAQRFNPELSRLPSSFYRRLHWLNQHQTSLVLLISALGVLSFWALRHTDHPYVRRAFTVGNPADHSWRNRVLAYEQALQMMGDRPFAGYGWSGWQEIHREFYQPSTQIEGAAITLNDYFVLGITSGTLSLIAFIGYIWLTVFPKQSQPNAPPAPDAFLQRVAHAGAIVLLVGFWFDGGLFKLALATPFWVLMELGYRPDSSPEEVSPVPLEPIQMNPRS